MLTYLLFAEVRREEGRIVVWKLGGQRWGVGQGPALHRGFVTDLYSRRDAMPA